MSRYYFDVFDGVASFDEDGMECDDIGTAKREALQRARAVLRGHGCQWDGDPWRLEIRDGKSRVVETLTFTASWTTKRSQARM